MGCGEQRGSRDLPNETWDTRWPPLWCIERSSEFASDLGRRPWRTSLGAGPAARLERRASSLLSGQLHALIGPPFGHRPVLPGRPRYAPGDGPRFRCGRFTPATWTLQSHSTVKERQSNKHTKVLLLACVSRKRQHVHESMSFPSNGSTEKEHIIVQVICSRRPKVKMRFNNTKAFVVSRTGLALHDS